MSLKQSVCVPMVKPQQMPLGDFLTAVAKIGFPAVEIWNRGDDFDELCAKSAALKLELCSMVGHNSLGDGLNQTSNHDRIEQELCHSIDVAVKHGVSGLICFSGNRQTGQTDLEGMLACAAGLRRVAPYAEKKNVKLNMELLNSRIDHAGYQCDRTDWGVAVCQIVNSSHVRLLYDIYHMQIMEGDVIRTIKNQVRWFGHFHTAGNPGRNDLDQSQELNYAAIAATIRATGYAGYLGHEFKPLGDPLAALKQAWDVCGH